MSQQVHIRVILCVCVCVFVADLTHFLLGHTPQDGVKLEVFSASQQVIDGVKLGTVAHVLMHLIYLCCYTVTHTKKVQLVLLAEKCFRINLAFLLNVFSQVRESFPNFQSKISLLEEFALRFYLDQSGTCLFYSALIQYS